MKVLSALSMVVLLAALVKADVVVLKNGEIYEGQVIKTTDTGIRFQAGDEVHFFDDEEIKTLKKSPGTDVKTSADKSTESTPLIESSASLTGPVTIPAGTDIHIRMGEAITSKHPQGHKFSATLETNISIDGKTAVPAGTVVYGRVAGSHQQKVVGQSALGIELTGLNINGSVVPIKTNLLAGKGERKIRQAARTAVVGAAIGGAVDGKSGAKTGAGVGAAASTVSSQTIGIPADTLLDFKITENVSLNN